MSFNLILCELFNKTFHGMDDSSDPNIQEQILVSHIFTNDCNDDINCILNNYKNYYRRLSNIDISHPTIRNYKHIISRPIYIQLQIAKVMYLAGQECVAVIKTIWIKIIQRKWKTIYKQRQNILNIRNLPSSIFYKQQHNKWPINCRYLPRLAGMLANLY
jgi:hypothetical protein